MRQRTYKAEGVVLKRINFGEKDRLITIFTPNLGKITLLAKGVRNIQSRKAPHLELFTRISFFAAAGRNIDIITEASTLASYPNLRKNLEKIAFSYSIAEILDRLCAERQEHKNIYGELTITLEKTDKSDNNDIIFIIDEFILRALWDLGYLVRGKIIKRPDLQMFLEEVMEKTLKSDVLLTKIAPSI